jgi:regulatory protein
MQTSSPAKPYKKNKTKRKPKKITQKYLYNSGLYYLERYNACTEHFRRTMKRKIMRSIRVHEEPPEEECHDMLENVIAEFQNLGYLNDELYTRGMVNSLRRKGLPSRMILMKLKQKGLDEDLIKETLETHDQDYGEEHDPDIIAAALFARRRKIGAYNKDYNKRDHELKKKMLAKLARSGFSYAQASQILDMDIEELETLYYQAR